MRKDRKIYAKYKLVAQTPSHSFVYRCSNDKEKLENLALKVSASKPKWKFIVAPTSFIV